MHTPMDSFFGKKGLLAGKLDHFEFRAEQLRMASAVEQALQEKQYLIAEAGTGTGKTLAYLIPSILSDHTVVISTATKNLQEQIYYSDVPFLQKTLHLNFRAAYMKGRTNYLCLSRFERFKAQPNFLSPKEASCFQDISHWAYNTDTGDRAELEDLPDDYPPWNAVCSDANLCLGQKCPHIKKCFITRLKQRAQQSDIIIVNHHLFFADLMLKVKGYGEVIPNFDAIVFDESHQIEEIATYYFGMSVSNYRLDELVRDTLREMKQAGYSVNPFQSLLDKLQSVYPHFFQHFNSPPARYRLRQHHLAGEAATSLSSLLNSLTALSSRLDNLSPKTETSEALSRRAQEIITQLSFIVEARDPAFVYWCEVKGRGVFLRASPIEAGKILNDSLFDEKDTIIFTSATLSTDHHFNYFREQLGLSSGKCVRELILDSDFDYQKQALLYLPKGLPAPDQKTFPLCAAREIEAILHATRGRAFVLCTSYKNMTEIYDYLNGRIPYKILLQGEKTKSVLLRNFKKDIGSVLLATASFWEGVDVQGEALSCVIIDKLPFNPPTEPLVEAKIEYINSRGGNAFLSYQIPSAIIALKQGLGRLIRNSQDRGVLAILDRRIVTKGYGRQFLSSIPACPITDSLSEVKSMFP